MRRPEFVARQSRCPSGFLGRVIGHVMSVETAAANDEALNALAPAAGDRVLEVGFGHGRTVDRAAAMVPDGLVAGIDTSEEMVRMATHRCRRWIAAGRVQLALGDCASIPYPDGFFDRAYTMHTIYFWEDAERCLGELRRVLTNGGRLVVGFHPRSAAQDAAFPESVYTFRTTEQVRELTRRAGFEVQADVEEGMPSGLALVIAHRL